MIRVETNKITIGILIFSVSVILVTTMSINQKSNNLRLNSIKDGNKVNEKEKGNVGHFIMEGSSKFRSMIWKQLISHEVYEESKENDCELEIINDLNEAVIICWIDTKGDLHNYFPINDASIKDGSVSNRHNEFTFVGHCFVCLRQVDTLPKNIRDVTRQSFIFSFSPSKPKHRHVIHLRNNRNGRNRRFFFFGKAKEGIDGEMAIEEINLDDSDILRTDDKVYESKLICGFLVNFEKEVFCIPHMEECLAEDLQQVVQLLPPKACLGSITSDVLIDHISSQLCSRTRLCG